jgi:hypothetical protein
MGIFVEIEDIKIRWSHIGPKESDWHFPCYGAVTTLVTSLVLLGQYVTIGNLSGEIRIGNTRRGTHDRRDLSDQERN